MKKGKDDEKIMEPMFPRLHVNDKEKGGPRAPPRNKMALYEQLSIPSQRFNSGVLPPNPNKTAGVVPPASSSQGTGHESGMFFPLHPHRSTHSAEKSYAGYSNLNTPLIQLEQNKKLDEEDFTVPIFVHSEIGPDHRKSSNGMDREKLSSFGSTYLGCSMKIQNTIDKEPKRTSNVGSDLRQEGKIQNEEDPKEFIAVGEQSVKSFQISSAREKTQGPLKQTVADQEHRDRLAYNFDRLQSAGASLHHESRARSQLHNSMYGNYVSNEPVRGIENGHSSILRGDSCPEELGSPNNPTFESGYHEDKTRGSLQIDNGDRENDASETSMVDSISGLDVSPDDVVGIIGQKHFWKARRAIVNQQRVFAVQVFELHRLIKVQRLIAGSPHLLLEDGAYLGKPLNVSSAKKLSVEYIVQPAPHILKRKDDSENPNHKMECSAENGVGKTSRSFERNVSQPSNYGPFSGDPLLAPVPTDAKMSPWGFHQPPGHQWLVPVMSPSEGLIYKPYPGHGLMGPVCGGCGLPGSNPMMGNFINPAYGLPLPHHCYECPVGQGYFPSYGVPVIDPVRSGSAVEQANQFAGLGSHGQPGQLSGGGANFNTQHQSSCNAPTQKNGAISNGVKLRASKESELLGSTASNSGERAQEIGTEGRNVLTLFPTSPSVRVPEGSPQLHDIDQSTRVIKVVPRNARSATESAARIFQSIQQEREQCDSV